jgi:hypothetical protein
VSDKQAGQQPIRVGAAVPEIYVDGYQGVSFKDGVVKLNFYSLQLDPSSNVTYKDVAARLTLSTGTLVSVHAALGNLLKDLRQAGVALPAAE